MSDPNVLHHDPLTGITDYFHVLEDGKEWAVESRQVMDGVLAVNQEMQKADTGRWGDGRCVASIPLIVLEQLQRDGMIDGTYNVRNNADFSKWLNKAENRQYRWKLGRV
jgi:hypothetical protein